MLTRTNRKFTALICLGAYMLTIIAPGGWMVWCIGSDGHQALELSHQAGSIANVASGNGSSELDQPARRVVSPEAALSCSGIIFSTVVCVDTPAVSILSARGSGLSKADQEVFKPISVVVSYMPAVTAPIRPVKPVRLADAPLDFTSLSALRVVILQI